MKKAILLAIVLALGLVGCHFKAPMYKPVAAINALALQTDGTYRPLANYPLKIKVKTDSGDVWHELVTDEKGLAIDYVEKPNFWVQEPLTGLEVPWVTHAVLPFIVLWGPDYPIGIVVDGKDILAEK